MLLRRCVVSGALSALLLAPVGAAYSSAEPGSATATSVSTSAVASSRASAAPTSKRVLAISVDALNPRAIRKLGRTGAPTFYRLMDEGAFTLNARSDYEQTVTLPNHTSMLTGRRIDRTRGGHGVTWNVDRPRATVQRAAGHRVDSVFTTLHRAGLTTALFTTKEKFRLFNRSWGSAIDRFRADEDQNRLVRTARRDLVARHRSFTFLHLYLPDRTGHAKGFMSPAYVRAVKRTDADLAGILRTITSHPALRRDLVVLLTADHGGQGKSHSDRTRFVNYRVPFMAWGTGISHAGLYAINPDRRDPGKGRPRYTGTQPIRNGEIANVATDVLGLGAVPGSEFDRRQDLDLTN